MKSLQGTNFIPGPPGRIDFSFGEDLSRFEFL